MFKKILTWICTRSFILYGITFLIMFVAVDHERISFGVKVRIIDNTMPLNFNLLVQLDASPKLEGPSSNDEILLDHAMWYQRIVYFFPDQADARSMLAFCHYFLGNYKSALDEYGKAYDLNSNVFWFPYNMGVIYFQSGDYKKAIELFKTALAIDSKETLEYIHDSNVVYLSILRIDNDWPEKIKLRLIEGRTNAYLLLLTSYFRLNQYNEMEELANEAIRDNIASKDIVIYMLGLAKFHQGKIKQANQHFQESININPALAAQLKGKENNPPVILVEKQYIKMF